MSHLFVSLSIYLLTLLLQHLQQPESEEPVKKAPEIIPETPDLDDSEVAELDKLVLISSLLFLPFFLLVTTHSWSKIHDNERVLLRDDQGSIVFVCFFCFCFCFENKETQNIPELESLKATMESKLLELERMGSVLRTARIDIGEAQGLCLSFLFYLLVIFPHC